MEFITECELAEFRRVCLSVPAVLALIATHVWVLLRLPVGVGKSFAIDQLLLAKETFERFDLLVYVAPSWNIINERTVVRHPDRAPVRVRVLRPRPTERCGTYNAEWEDLEKRGCASHAKQTLCATCRASDPGVPCEWPDQMRDMDGVGIVVLTEAQFHLNRSTVLRLRHLTGARRVLAVFDEATIIDKRFEIQIPKFALEQLEEVLLQRADQFKDAPAWLASVRALLRCRPSEIGKVHIRTPWALLRRAFLLQRTGVELFGKSFHFAGYDVLQFAHSRRHERHKRMDGTIVFVARPYLHVRVVITSAFLDAAYAGHRLRTDPLPSPFANVIVRHSKTRIVNLRSRAGAYRYFEGNRKRILDTFAVLILRNLSEGRTTLLVCRKKSKRACATYLRERLAGWGYDVRFLLDKDPLPAIPTPTTIPLIHYGVLGVNDYQHYESAFCLHGYYISDSTLRDALETLEGGLFSQSLRIVSRDTHVRRVELLDPSELDLDHTMLGNMHLQRMEVDPVLQALGRVRFVTEPREIVAFQMADLSAHVGEVEVVETLTGLRKAFGLPNPDDIDDWVARRTIDLARSAGLTMAKAAAKAGISRRTAFRRLKAGESAKTHQINSLMRNGTLRLDGRAS